MYKFKAGDRIALASNPIIKGTIRARSLHGNDYMVQWDNNPPGIKRFIPEIELCAIATNEDQ